MVLALRQTPVSPLLRANYEEVIVAVRLVYPGRVFEVIYFPERRQAMSSLFGEMGVIF